MTTSCDFNPDQYLTPAQLVDRWSEHPLLKMSYVTLARRRAAGKPPEFLHAGHNDRVYYHIDAIEAYELSRNPHAINQRQSLQEHPEGDRPSA